jgi:2',3'-cyclic-nucleotide 2'-phosphodiesterase (5'-nucleotidase family)
MTKLRKSVSYLKYFIVTLTFLIFLSCSTEQYRVTKIKGKQIPVDQQITPSQEIEDTIAPYRNHINIDLDNVLAYCPETLDKNQGKWTSTIGNLLADITLQKADMLFQKRYQQKVDICLLNHGGIRATLPQGNVTTRNAYEIMPFENNLVVAELKAEQIVEMVNYFIVGKKAHPISGIEITLNSDETSYNSILIQGQPLEMNRTYLVATSDYLLTGGDSMTFFAKALNTYDMEYKLRNLIIDYFKETDTIPVIRDNRVRF